MSRRLLVSSSRPSIEKWIFYGRISSILFSTKSVADEAFYLDSDLHASHSYARPPTSAQPRQPTWPVFNDRNVPFLNGVINERVIQNLKTCLPRADYVAAEKAFQLFGTMRVRPCQRSCDLLFQIYRRATDQWCALNPERHGSVYYKTALPAQLILRAMELYSLMVAEGIPLSNASFEALYCIACQGGQLDLIFWIMPNAIAKQALVRLDDGSVTGETSLNPDGERFPLMQSSIQRLRFADLPPYLQSLPRPSPCETISGSTFAAIILSSRSLPISLSIAYFISAVGSYGPNLVLVKALLACLKANCNIRRQTHRFAARQALLHTTLLLRFCAEGWSVRDYEDWTRHVFEFQRRLEAAGPHQRGDIQRRDFISGSSLPDASLLVPPLSVLMANINPLKFVLKSDVPVQREVIALFRKLGAFAMSIDYFRQYCLSETLSRYDPVINAYVISSLFFTDQISIATSLYNFLERHATEVHSADQVLLRHLDYSSRESSSPTVQSLFTPPVPLQQSPCHPLMIPLSAYFFGMCVNGSFPHTFWILRKCVLEGPPTHSLFTGLMTTCSTSRVPPVDLYDFPTKGPLCPAYTLHPLQVGMCIDFLRFALLPRLRLDSSVRILRRLLEWWSNTDANALVYLRTHNLLSLLAHAVHGLCSVLRLDAEAADLRGVMRYCPSTPIRFEFSLVSGQKQPISPSASPLNMTRTCIVQDRQTWRYDIDSSAVDQADLRWLATFLAALIARSTDKVLQHWLLDWSDPNSCMS